MRMNARSITPPVLPHIDANASIQEAKDALLRLNARWLAVHENGVLTGTVDTEQLNLAAAGARVADVIQGGEGVVRWLT